MTTDPHPQMGWNQHGRLSEHRVNGYWKQPCSIWIHTEHALDESSVQDALVELSSRHTALRCTYRDSGSDIEPLYGPSRPWDLLTLHADSVTQQHEDALCHTFHPYGEDLKRAVLIIRPGGAALGISVDHSICDDAALAIIVDQLITTLEGGPNGEGSDVREFYHDEREYVRGDEAASIVGDVLARLERFGSAYPTVEGFFDPVWRQLSPGSAVRRLTIERGAPAPIRAHSPVPSAGRFALVLTDMSTGSCAFLMPFHRRQSPRDKKTVGYLTSKIAVVVDEERRSASGIPEVMAGLQAGRVPHELLLQRHAEATATMISTPPAHVTFNHVPDQLSGRPGWVIAPTSGGGDARHNLGLNVIVTHETAHAQWTPGVLDERQVSRLLSALSVAAPKGDRS